MDIELMWLKVIKFFQTLFPADIWCMDYLNNVFEKYTNVGGFIAGVAVIIMLFFASVVDDKKKGMIRVFAMVTLINAIDGVYILLMNFVNTNLLNSPTYLYETYIQGAFNPLSIMIVVLVISECYHNDSFGAFFFGLSTFGVTTLMFSETISFDGVMLYLIVRALVAAIICAIASKIKYVFVLQITMGIFFIISEATSAYILHMNSNASTEEILSDMLKILGTYKAEYLIITFIVIVFPYLRFLFWQKLNLK